MPTIAQMRAARALLDWSQSDLADKAGLSQTGIARIENGTNQPNSSTLEKIGAAFDEADIEFIEDTGVKKRKGAIKSLKGSEGLYKIMNDIYKDAKNNGGEICLFNARPNNWLKWIDDEWFYNVYSKNMADLGEKIDMRIMAIEGETDLISKGHAKNRYLPRDLFISDTKSIYVYGDKIGFIDFDEENVEILLLESAEFAMSMRVLFNIAWDKVAVNAA